MLDSLFQQYLADDGVSVSLEDLQALKEKCSTVADSREEYIEVMEESKPIEAIEHTLPDGQAVKIGKQR